MRNLTAVLPLLLLSSIGHARSASWFVAGADSVDIVAPVELPLLRGEVGGYRPLIEVTVPASGEDRSVLAVVDLGHSWTKLGRALASDLGIEVESTDLHGKWTQRAELDELKIGEAVFHNLRVEVVAGSALVLGFAALPEVAAAVLPSKGVVRIVPGDAGEALVAEVGEPLPITVESNKSWKLRGEKVFGSGLSVMIPGGISGREGLIGIRTDSFESLVTSSYEGSVQQRRGGVVYVRGRGKLGGYELGETWLARDESLSSSGEPFIGTLGYNQLYELDIALSLRSATAAVAPVETPRWQPAAKVALEIARAHHRAAGLSDEQPSVDRPPKLSFSSTPTPEDREGHLGDRRVARLERELAEALWRTGEIDESMPHFLRSATAAGDRCGAKMELGLRRLASSGNLQRHDFVVQLIRKPLREAGMLWDRWAALSPDIRRKVRAYEDVPRGTFRVPQDPRCVTAWGTLMAAYVAQENTDEASKIYREHYGRDPLVAYAQGLSLLAQGQPKTAEIPIREALSASVAERGDIKLGLGWAQVDQGLEKPVRELLKEVPSLQVDYSLTAALIALEWGDVLKGREGRVDVSRRLLRADPFWIPGQLLGLFLGLEEADAGQLRAEIVRQRARRPGSIQSEVYAAVEDALEGNTEAALVALTALKTERPPAPDVFAAVALVGSLRGEGDAVEDALAELRLRYPNIPFRTLGLIESGPLKSTQ